MTSFDIKKFDSKKNMYIKASAGTGKTYTIQQIVAKLLKEDPELTLDKILIVTFTEKAAGELKDRIRSKLEDEQLLEHLAVVDDAPIYTIHSFCQQTLEEFSFTANKPSDLGLIDEGEISSFLGRWIRDKMPESPLYQKALFCSDGGINQTFQKMIETAQKKYYLDSKGQEVPDIITLDKVQEGQTVDKFTAKDLTRLSGSDYNKKDLNFILNFYDQINNTEITTETPVLETRIPDAVAEFDANMNEFLQEIADEKAAIEAKQQERYSDGRKKQLEQIDDYLNSDRMNLAQKKLLAVLKDSKYASPRQIELFEYFEGLKAIKKNIEVFVKDIEEQLESALFQKNLPEIYKAWNEEKARNKTQSFDDMIRNVRESICEKDSKLKEVLKQKYRFAIIDEFQDTNQRQWDIFRSIFMEDNDHSIYVVGDPKQSIYAFQGADLNVYTRAINEIEQGTVKVEAGEAYSLDTNWRSTKLMIEGCNALFRKNENSDFFNGNSFEFTDSLSPEGDDEKPAALYYNSQTENWEETKPFWVPEFFEIVDENVQKLGTEPVSFAEYCVSKIADFCTFVEKDGKRKTKLQVFKKCVVDGKKVNLLGNVSFGDFAVLCKSKAEMDYIKNSLAEAGIPYSHYKEGNLFSGLECCHWISLFKAVNAESFTGRDRKLLNEALFTEFFKVPLDKVEDSRYDEPDCAERMMLIQWHILAQKRLWPQLLEKIFEDSKIETRLSKLDKLSVLSKYRQIGDYCIDYLCNNNCSLEELINHLILLSARKSSAEDDDGDLVAKGTDLNCVQIMTIHASKGLEFPVVILPTGFKGPRDNKEGVYFYHYNDQLHVTSDTLQKKQEAKENNLEVMRLFYVAYTRALSLIISPWNCSGEWEELKNAYENSDAKVSDSYLNIEKKNPFDYDPQKEKEKVAAIIAAKSAEAEDSFTEENQRRVNQKLSAELKQMKTSKLSYSVLTHGKPVTETISENSNGNEEADDEYDLENLSHLDLNSQQVFGPYDSTKCVEIIKNYPKGAVIGNAVHQVFEFAPFKEAGNLTLEDALKNGKINGLVTESFREQNLEIDENDSKKWKKQTVEILWNTLNAKLPVILGKNSEAETFSLNELEDDCYLAEVEFNMNPEIQQNQDYMKDYFNGFIDLLFVRNVNGEKVYSIADWKTDTFESPELYASGYVLKEHTDKHYSIQRVLYTYCLIQWLKQFYPEKSEEQIFQENFGGVYYIFVKGCVAGTGNGIYSHTWESWGNIKQAFDLIIKERVGNRQIVR